ncbi:lambda-exonuclease family protein [Petroclostridium sp. X23]|uniref:YqaJ viral recombinase family nuclease n=1 Tax=Petroclostridium sp. X23 TaxID=3045146 RepID=UPI0024AD3A19|nr:YqaJ viral recombinase family protein [Petroclostridium sp. X23]WHH58286.1 YqaJ viral recombinase family protein [Petroclostridium sp. X23]
MSANVLVKTLGMSEIEWLKWRKNGIGGSDAAAIAGLNPWKSPLGVYLDKIKEIETFEDNERMRIGRDLEDYVADRFSEATGLKVRRCNSILQHPQHEFMLANIDRDIVGKREGLECKTTNSYAKGDWEGDKIPAHYEIQCHHYMAVTGYDAWWIAVLIGNEKFVYKRIDRDEDVINYLINIEKDFWENYVLKEVMPAPDGSDYSQELINGEYGMSVAGATVYIDPMDEEFKEKANRYDELKELIGKLETEKKKIAQNIQLRMGENEILQFGDRKIKWKSISQTRFDSKGFKKDHPGLYEKYTNTTSYRRFDM